MEIAQNMKPVHIAQVSYVVLTENYNNQVHFKTFIFHIENRLLSSHS